MSKFDKNIIVVENAKLFGDKYFQGFNNGIVNYESSIVDNLKIMRRGDAEKDFEHKQPIGYALIIDSNTKKIFAYQRNVKDEHYAEKRLQGKWSWGFGGHIEPQDGTNNPIQDSLIREIKEETGIKNPKKIKVLGYINDDRDEVGKVHFGILYAIETNEPVNLCDESLKGEFKSLSELEEICKTERFDVEGWSEIALNPLREYISLLK